VRRYDERIDRVETRITARLRDQLGTARNANEMFRIFSRYNALFVRPHIRGAIREYQTQLIQRVKDDIESLHEKFKVPFSASFLIETLCLSCYSTSFYDSLHNKVCTVYCICYYAFHFLNCVRDENENITFFTLNTVACG